jgi:hypothetical protein
MGDVRRGNPRPPWTLMEVRAVAAAGAGVMVEAMGDLLVCIRE